MRVLFNMAHPAQVHFFSNAIKILENKGHKCKITTINKDVSLNLLGSYGFDYEVVGSSKPSLFSKATELVKIESRLLRIAGSFKPDLLVGGSGNAYVAHVGTLIGKPSIIFDNSEHAKIEHFLTDFFVTAICTSSSYTKYLGKKHVIYNGYHELAYLHPNYFTPNQSILNEIGLSPEDIYIVLRFVRWDADHDIGQHGIKNKIRFVKDLEKYGKVLITSEGRLDPELEDYKMKVSPEKLHDLLYYSTLYVGEGATTASECAVLGTHAIYVNTLRVGYTDEQEQKYGLVYNFSDSKSLEIEAFNKAIELLENENLREEGKRKRKKLLADKIDVTKFIVNYIEQYSF